MTNRKNTKRALMLSCLSLLLCVSMLVGSTFAWFTDVASTSGNKIQAGTLQVELWEKDANGVYQDISTSSQPVFNYDLWEPGYRDYAELMVKNVGTLALRYEIHFQNVITTPGYGGSTADIAEVLDVYIGGDKVGTLRELVEKDYILATSNTLKKPAVTVDGILPAGESVELPKIEVVMQEGAGNKYQGCGVTFDVVLRAIQATYEPDGYNNPNYDSNANGSPDNAWFDFDSVKTNDTVQDASKPLTVTATDGKTTFTVPGNSVAPNTDISFSMTPSNTALEGGVSYTDPTQAATYFDIEVKQTVNGQKVPAYAQIIVDTKPTSVVITHKGNTVNASTGTLDINTKPATAGDQYWYDPATGTVTVWLEDYSPVAVMYEADAVVNNVKYETLAAAVAAAKSGDTITLLGDAAGQGIVINKSVTIDFGGFTYTVDKTPLAGSDSGHATQCFQLLKQSEAVTLKNGTIKADNDGAYMMIQNYTNLTLDGITIDEKANTRMFYILSCNAGNTVVKDSTLIGGTYAALDVMHWPEGGYATAPSVTVNNSTIDGKVDVYCDSASTCDVVPTLIVNSGSFSQDLTAYAPVGMKCEKGDDGMYIVAIADFYPDADGVWHIRTPEGMQEFKAACEGNKNGGFKGQTIVLDCDINMYGKYWEPICGDDINAYPSYSFKGTFNGNNHVISNLEVIGANDVNSCAGLFGSLSDGAVVRNVILKDSTIRGNHWAGAIAGYVSDGNGATITECQVINCTIIADYYVNGTTVDNGDKAGGIIGYAASGSYTNNIVKDCFIKGYRELGGIAGVTNAATVVVTGNTVENVTITVFNTHNYKNYASLEAHLTGDVVGNKYSGVVENNETSDVTVVAAE